MYMEGARFRVLLAEDDPVSRDFLCEAIRACGADVSGCVNGSAALALAQTESFDLLIIDHHLPGLNGDTMLEMLRADIRAASHATPAIATSATRDDEAILLRAGFVEVLSKPMSLEALSAAIRRQGCPADSPLDDDDALRACGSPLAVARLRRLFAEQELPRVQDELDRLTDNPQALRPTLHRLRASCGFCGARTLADAVAALHRALATGADANQVGACLGVFRRVLAETRAALHDSSFDADSGVAETPEEASRAQGEAGRLHDASGIV